ncbi:MAG: hypothetical protein QMD04_13980 [Anaerolineales bacterium]|nr:hypothetical protein [Anaerolineales bacterium]
MYLCWGVAGGILGGERHRTGDAIRGRSPSTSSSEAEILALMPDLRPPEQQMPSSL